MQGWAIYKSQRKKRTSPNVPFKGREFTKHNQTEMHFHKLHKLHNFPTQMHFYI